ncbi:AMP-binding protein [Acidobacteria bacterium AH-259-L09]|nr:AMP-binding protein [Acidobacteria bacterium AH-259-L09]
MNRIIQALEGKVIFITGATGFLGKPIVEKILLTTPSVKRIYLLIRPKRQLGGKVIAPEGRLKRELFQSSVFDRLYFAYGDTIEEFLKDKVVAVAGDISRERLGLDATTWHQLQEEVHIVINSAAVVSFDAPLNAALELNVLSVARVAEFARLCKKAVLIHISTAYTSGASRQPIPETIHHTPPSVEGKKLHPQQKFTSVQQEIEHIQNIITGVKEAAQSLEINNQLKEALLKRSRKPRRGGKKVGREEKIRSLRRKWIKSRLIEQGMIWARQQGWNDTYTYTKALGEQVVVKTRAQIPTVIIRPSVIESSLSEPSPGWLDGLRMADPLIVAIGKGRLRSLPMDADVTLDLIPVDMVVNIVLASIPPAINKGGLHIYHIATGAKNPIRLGELYRLIYQYFQKNPMLDKEGNPIHVKPLRFPKPASFRIQHKLKRVSLGTMERTLKQLPFSSTTEKAKRKISAARAAHERLYYYGEIYQPYLNSECHFEVDNTLRLYNSLNEEEKSVFNFDITRLNWRHYIQNVHIPGVKKYILKREGAGTLEIGDPITTDSLTINTLVKHSTEKFPNKTALQIKRNGQWQRFTYKDLWETSKKISQTFLAMGLRKGDRVVLYSENQPEWGITYLGATFIGLVVIPLDAQTWHKEVWATIQFTTARALLASESCFKKLTPQALGENEHSESPARLLNVNRFCAPFRLNEYPRSTQVPSPQVAVEGEVEVKPDDLASIIFTSSTAVDPKGAMHTHRNFINNLLGVNRYLPIAESDQLLSVLPLYHALEFTCGFLMAIYGGATVTYLHSLKPKLILEIMRETGTTCMLGVPTLYTLIRDDVERRILRTPKSALKSNLFTTSKQLSRPIERTFGKNIGRRLFTQLHEEFGGWIRLFVSGGSALGEELYEDFKVFGMPIYEGYGLTETAPVLTVNPLKRSRRGSAGKPLPGVELQIFNADKDGIGEIIVQTPSLMRGYYENPKATKKVMKDGWFHTGDLGWVDADGYVYITGRIKDVIVTGAGKNVYPADLEALYQGIPGIKEICVLGVKSGLTEDVHAVLTLKREPFGKPKPEAAKRAIQREIQKVAKELPSYQRLQHIHIHSKPLPRKDSGEICRDTVRHQLLEQLGSERPRLTRQPLKPNRETNPEQELLRELSRLSGVPEQQINKESHLYLDLGLDSLMAIELLLFTERRFAVSIPDQVATNLGTVGQLLREVQSQASATRAPEGKVETEQVKIHSALPHSNRAMIKRYLQSLSYSGLKTLYKTYFDLQLDSHKHLPCAGPYIIAANHASHLDTGAMISAVSIALGIKEARKLHILGAKDYFFDTPLKSWFFSTFLNVVPVEREETSLAGLRMVKSILSAGELVLIFPEGTRSRTGQIQQFKPGLGLIALELDVPIIPAYIGGTHQAMPVGKVFPRPKQVKVIFAPPITMDVYRSNDQDTPADEIYRQITADVRGVIMNLPLSALSDPD